MSSAAITIYSVVWEEACASSFHDEACKKVSEREWRSIAKFQRIEDRLNKLLACLLLRQALDEHSYSRSLIGTVCTSPYGRPEHEEFKFNISHSGKLVVLAFSAAQQVGIDVEAYEKVCLADFTPYFTEEEWETIHKAPCRFKEFYKFWTRKEALIKIDGRGLSFPLEKIELYDGGGDIESKRYILTALTLGADYVGHLATTQSARHTMVSIDAETLIYQS